LPKLKPAQRANRIVKTAIGTPRPIPIFAPVLRPAGVVEVGYPAGVIVTVVV
jgi:hypothetical protein